MTPDPTMPIGPPPGSDARRGRSVGNLAVTVAEELWYWVEAVLGALPGRAGRVVRGLVLARLFPQARAVAEFVHIRRPQHLRCGPRVSIGRGVQLIATGGLAIGSEVGIGANTVILTSSHDFSDPTRAIREGPTLTTPVVLEDHVWVGANCVIMPGVRIGEGTIVGAGAVVTKDLPSYSIAGGVPAGVIGTRPGMGDAE